MALSWSEPHQQNLGINAGLINRFRVSDAWDINLELRGLLMKDAFGGTSKEGMAGVTVGVTYKFKKRGFNAVPTVPMVPESQLDDMRNRLNSLKGENESLKRDLVEARNKKPEVIVKKEARVFHICEFAEIMEANGKSYCPAECKEKEERKEAVKGEKKTGTTRMERSRR